ncbi:unnamed protein product [Trichobilharzia regenti]|uniref:Gelsolin-like domain-containing protein n=1 Tax=Trichobilharzia regenti TaxID=157069 RepID=A0A183VNA6_TRIRE|nr:unnamed protein product [Trichobilharzia regenti]VDP97841.1 unnamed protein product [Trichobilharzia regenti]
MPSTNKIKTCGRRKRLRYFESTADLISRKIITSGEEFNHNQVHTLLLSLKSRKPLSRSKLRCEPDGIRLKRISKFSSPPPRKFYAYKDIEHYYVFDNDPTILILGCIDREQNSRYYDFFKLPESHYKDITTLIDKARSHSDYVLNEDDTTLPTPGVYSSHSSLNVSTEHLSHNNNLPSEGSVHENESYANIGISNKTENDNITKASTTDLRGSTTETIQPIETQSLQQNSDDHDDVIIHNHYDDHEDPIEPILIKCEQETWGTSLKTTAPPDHQKASPVSMKVNEPLPKVVFNEDDDDDSEIASLKMKFKELKEKDETFAKLSENINVNDLTAMDFRYVATHPEHGNRIADNGDVYIFIAHYKRPENIKNLDAYNPEAYTNVDEIISGEHHRKSTADKNFCLQYI